MAAWKVRGAIRRPRRTATLATLLEVAGPGDERLVLRVPPGVIKRAAGDFAIRTGEYSFEIVIVDPEYTGGAMFQRGHPAEMGKPGGPGGSSRWLGPVEIVEAGDGEGGFVADRLEAAVDEQGRLSEERGSPSIGAIGDGIDREDVENPEEWDELATAEDEVRTAEYESASVSTIGTDSDGHFDTGGELGDARVLPSSSVFGVTINRRNAYQNGGSPTVSVGE